MSKERKRMCFFIPADGFIEGHGFRVSIVTEGEPGHTPTGEWPNNGTGVMPWFWGQTFGEAEAIARQQNEKLGHSARDVAVIVASSMVASNRAEAGA